MREHTILDEICYAELLKKWQGDTIMSDNDWLDPKKLEKEFGISTDTQQKYRSEKKIPYSKIGGFIFYSRNKINKWIEEYSFEANSGSKTTN